MISKTGSYKTKKSPFLRQQERGLYKRSYRGITALNKQIIPQDRFICHTQK
nr:MAG TPA: hypothetical protein [Caudoviricetes sp.]